MIANESDGIMILTKVPFQIDMMTDCRNDVMKVMVTIRFFEVQDGMISTTEKTEIEIEAEVYISVH